MSYGATFVGFKPYMRGVRDRKWRKVTASVVCSSPQSQKFERFEAERTAFLPYLLLMGASDWRTELISSHFSARKWCPLLLDMWRKNKWSNGSTDSTWKLARKQWVPQGMSSCDLKWFKCTIKLKSQEAKGALHGPSWANIEPYSQDPMKY